LHREIVSESIIIRGRKTFHAGTLAQQISWRSVDSWATPFAFASGTEETFRGEEKNET
jgi:hypothetical protein